nr:RNA-directed DNA polymerase homolog [Tanacetum cinerariifolium]
MLQKCMKSKYSRDDYLYCADHTAKLVQEQWMDTVNHDGKWTKEEKEEDSNEVHAVSFYPRTEPVEPLEWKSLEKSMKPSSVEPPKHELKELPEHLETIKGRSPGVLRILKSLGESCPGCPKEGRNDRSKNEKDELIPQRTITRWRVCIDYRKLNNATRKYHFPLPFIDQMLERLAGHEYYCFLDRFSGYFQISIAPEDQEKTTFTSPSITFGYKRIPFGLCNAPTTFQRCMTTIFHELIEDIMEVFMDDFSIFGNSFDHFLKNLKKMLKWCDETNLVLNWEKCHFMVKEGIVLSHKALIMIKPDWSLPFEVMCNVSDYAVRAVVGQRIDKHFKPIHYALKTINETQGNYTTTEKELWM